MKAKERFARTASGFGSDGSIDGPSDRATPVWPESDRQPYAAGASDMEFVRPQTVGEEELQLQLAIAMSKEEADQEDQKRRSDDVRLQLALSQSENDFKKTDTKKNESNLVDLLDAFGSSDLAVGGNSMGAGASTSSTDPWGMPVKQNLPSKSNDLWTSNKPADPWLPPPPTAAARTISPSSGNASAVEGWLNNVSPQAPVLPAKPNASINNELEGAWGGKPALPISADPWNVTKTQPTQVPNSDPWNLHTNGKPASADPWAPVAGTNGIGVSCYEILTN